MMLHSRYCIKFSRLQYHYCSFAVRYVWLNANEMPVNVCESDSESKRLKRRQRTRECARCGERTLSFCISYSRRTPPLIYSFNFLFELLIFENNCNGKLLTWAHVKKMIHNFITRTSNFHVRPWVLLISVHRMNILYYIDKTSIKNFELSSYQILLSNNS